MKKSRHSLAKAPSNKGKSFKKKALFGAALACTSSVMLVVAAGPGTGALWQGAVIQPGAHIQSGLMHLELSGVSQAYDTSPDVTAHLIDLAANKIVPGDVTSIQQAEAITMSGANLKADLAIKIPAAGALSGALATPGSGVTAVVYFGSGTYDPATWTQASALASAPLDGTGTGAVVHFNQPALNGNTAALNDGSLTDGTAKLFTVTVITYAASATDTTVMGASADVAAITSTLTQVR
jgi:alternate signal-mediated exported protein